jgi:hypothetical protein
MALTDKIKKDISEKKQQKLDNIEYFKEQILITDALKEDYDNAVKSIDTDLLNDITTVNNTLIGVQSSYQDRIDAGCRTDLFWRVVGFDTNTGDYSLIVTKLSIVGYGTSVAFLNSSGGITTYADGIIEIPGVEGDNLHAIKYYDEPYMKDIGDTTIGSFIGIVGTASTILTVMSQSSEELISTFDVGNLIISSKDGVFSGDSNKIVGFGTTTVTGITTTVMEEVVGIATTSFDTYTIILETPTVGFSSLPESDGSYTDFTVVTDPDTFDQTKTRFKYQVKFGKNPFSPQTIGIMDSNTIGIGTFIEYDNSAKPPATQSWKPELEGVEKNGEKIKAPKVGAGRIYNIVGFSSEPTYLGSPQSEGATVITSLLTGLYTLISPPGGCTAIESALTSAISARNNAESALSSGSNCIQTKVDAANALRKERAEYSLKIWGLRQTIGGESEGIDQYEALETYIDNTEGTINGTTSCL